MLNRPELEHWMLQYLSRTLHIPPHDLDLAQPLVNFGLDSADAILMSGALEDRFGIELEPTAFLQVETVRQLIETLSSPDGALVPLPPASA